MWRQTTSDMYSLVPVTDSLMGAGYSRTHHLVV
jgi:hypothetical protein